jgi:histidine decarboxylase
MTLTDYGKKNLTTGGDKVVEPTDKDFVLPAGGLDEAKRRATLDKLEKYFSVQRKKFLGYQTNESFDYRSEMSRFLDYHFNNVGDPFEDSHFTLHTRWAERAVLDYYAKLWHAKPRTVDGVTKKMAEDAYWGYVLTMGSSEGNNYALWNARDYLAGKTLMREPGANGNANYMWVQDTPPANNHNAYSPVCFYSHDTHYSVAKAMRVLDIPSFFEVGTKLYPHANPLSPGSPWAHEVPSEGGDDGPGSIDVAALTKLVDFFASMGHPILVSLNYGSTFKCAYDDVEKVCAQLRPIFKKYHLDKRRVRYGRDSDDNELVDERTGYWVHVDGALGATYAPFLEKAIAAKKVSEKNARLPKFDFRIPEVCSIVTSGHKYPGAPWPCGIFMTKSNLQMQPPEQPAVIGSPDTTFGGSRNAFSPLIMWDFLAKHSEQAQIEMIAKAEELAAYAERELRALGEVWAVGRTPLSLSVRFKKPSAEIVHRYSLATVPLRTGKGQVDYAHLYVMPHVTKQLIDNLVADLRGAKPEKARRMVDGTDLWSYADGIAHVDDVERLALVRTWGNGF